MSELSINVRIADRSYPLVIDIDEEERIRRAARLINEKIAELKKAYPTKDLQDFLSMTALEVMVEVIKHQSVKGVEDAGVSEKIQAIDQKLKDFFEQS